MSLMHLQELLRSRHGHLPWSGRKEICHCPWLAPRTMALLPKYDCCCAYCFIVVCYFMCYFVCCLIVYVLCVFVVFPTEAGMRGSVQKSWNLQR